jgi:hypothetical protein
MHILRIEHPVPDYDSWKAAFDSDPVGRERSAVRRYRTTFFMLAYALSWWASILKPVLGHRKLKNLAPDHVQYFYQSKLNAGLAVGTVRLMYGGILHKALEQAVKWGACTPQHLQGHDASEAELRRDTSPGCRAGQAVPGGGPRQPPRDPLRACHHCGLEDRRAPGAQMGRHRPRRRDLTRQAHQVAGQVRPYLHHSEERQRSQHKAQATIPSWCKSCWATRS